MRHSVAVLALATVASLFTAPQALAQTTIVTNPLQLIAGGHDHHKKPNRSAKNGCALPTLICAGKKAADLVGDAAVAGAGAAADTVMGGVVSWAADGAAWIVSAIGTRIDRSTRPALESPWYARRYATMVQLAVALAAVFLLLATGQAIVRQDVWLLGRAAFVSLPLAMVLTFAGVTLVETGLAVTDWMTSAVLSGFGADARGAFRDLAGLLGPTAITGSPLAPFVLFLVSVATALLGLVVWLELVMREAAIYVAVAFLPLTLAAMIWDRSALWARRLAELLAAIILSKFTIAVAFAVAASAIRGSRGDAGGLTGVLAGCGVLLVAALTPWALLKLIPFMEAAAGRGLTRGHVSGAANAAPGATTATVAARQLMLKQFGTKGGAARTPSATQPATALRGTSAAVRTARQGRPIATLPEEERDRRPRRDRDEPRS
jgi:hypothetical protein